MSRVCSNSLIYVFLFCSGFANAEDQLWYLPPQGSEKSKSQDWLPQPFRQITGQVKDFAGGKVRIVSTSNPQRPISMSVDFPRVIWIEPDWNREGAALAKAFDSLRNGDAQTAMPVINQYVRTTKSAWRQRIAYGTLMQAAADTKNYRAALLIAVGFHNAAPPDYLYAMLPVAWAQIDRDASRDATAMAMLAHENPAVRLVAASWVYSGPNRQRADTTLANLSNDSTIPLIARMADAVRWRSVAGPKVLESLPRWESKLAGLPIAIQPGPMTTIAERLETNGASDAALKWWLAVEHFGKRTGNGLSKQAAARVLKITASEDAGQ